MNILIKIGALLLCIAVSGCGWWNTVFRDFNVDGGTGAMIDIKQRAIMVSRQPQSDGQSGVIQTIVCAEPSPDALAAYAAEFAGQVDFLGKANAGITGASQENAAFIGLRTQSIQLLRDSLYRLCEGYMGGALNKDEYSLLTRRYQRYMIALLGIEQLTGAIRTPTVTISTEGKVHVAASLTEMRKQVEIIDQEIAKKQAAQVDLEQQEGRALVEDQKKKLQAEIQSIKTGIMERQADKEAINTAITDARGMMAGGSGTASVSPMSLPLQRSDQHIQTVANVVEKIVMEAMGVDDFGNFCWRYLTDSKNSKDEGLKKACSERLTQIDQDRKYIRESHQKWFDWVLSNTELTSQQKADIFLNNFQKIFSSNPIPSSPTTSILVKEEGSSSTEESTPKRGWNFNSNSKEIWVEEKQTGDRGSSMVLVPYIRKEGSSQSYITK